MLSCLLYMGQVFKPEYDFVFAALWKMLGQIWLLSKTDCECQQRPPSSCHQTRGLAVDQPLCAGAAIVHPSPVLCPQCVCAGEVGRVWPHSSLTPISFQGNTRHDKGSQSKTIKSSDPHRKQDSPTVGHRTNVDGGSLVIKQLFQRHLFKFAKQLLARDDSLLFNCCKLGVLAIIQHNSCVMFRGFH